MKRAIYIGSAWANETEGRMGFGITGTVVQRNERQWDFVADDGRKFVFYTEELYFPDNF